MDTTERARRYLAVMDASVSGAGGHNACFAAAMALVRGFGLDEAVALRLLREDYNPRCVPPWSERELKHKIDQAAKSADGERGYLLGKAHTHGGGGSRPSFAPAAGGMEPERENKRREFDAGALGRMMVRGFTASTAWLAERSPVDPRRCTPMDFLDRVFLTGEKTYVFTRFFSQGDFGFVAGAPGSVWRLGARPGQAPERVTALPESGREGAWFLPCPMDGKWHPSGGTDKRGNPVVSRRSGPSVVQYRHMLLESDDAEHDQWLNFLVQMPFPITALYTSGGRSIHALVRIAAGSKGEFDAFRDRIAPFLTRMGADLGAISGVRLTRLPGVLREGTTDKDGRYQKYDSPRLQRLLYLNPNPECFAIKLLPQLRAVKRDS